MTLGACSVMNEKECAVADWQAIGFSDGASGRTQASFNERAKACSKHGLFVDSKSYQRGRNEGLKSYCTKNNGFTIGVRGGRYYGVCEGKSHTHFSSGYNKGKAVYKQRSRVQSLKSNIESTERKITFLLKEKNNIQNKIVAAQEAHVRSQLVADLDNNSRERRRLQNNLEDMRKELKSEKNILVKMER